MPIPSRLEQAFIEPRSPLHPVVRINLKRLWEKGAVRVVGACQPQVDIAFYFLFYEFKWSHSSIFKCRIEGGIFRYIDAALENGQVVLATESTGIPHRHLRQIRPERKRRRKTEIWSDRGWEREEKHLFFIAMRSVAHNPSEVLRDRRARLPSVGSDPSCPYA